MPGLSPHAAADRRKAAGQMVASFSQPQHIQQFIDKFLIRSPIVKQQRESDILFHIQFRDQIERLKDKSNVLTPEHG